MDNRQGTRYNGSGGPAPPYKRKYKIKALIVTNDEKEFIRAKELFKCESSWIYRHEQIKPLSDGVVVLLPGCVKLPDFDSLVKTIINKGFKIVDMVRLKSP